MDLVNALGVRWNSRQGVSFHVSPAELFFAPWHKPSLTSAAQLEEEQADSDAETVSIQVDCFIIVPKNLRSVEGEQTFSEILYLPGPVPSN